MLRRLDKIRFRGHKREDFLDLAESPNASDTECGDEIPVKIPRTSTRDSEELRDPVSAPPAERAWALPASSCLTPPCLAGPACPERVLQLHFASSVSLFCFIFVSGKLLTRK